MLELGRAKRAPSGLVCHTPDSLGLQAKDRRSLGKQAVGLLRFLDLKRVYVSAQCPIGIVRELEGAGFQVRVAREPIFPDRLLKQDAEVSAMRASQRAAVDAMKKAIELIRESSVNSNNQLLTPAGDLLTAEGVRTEIEMVLMRHGCVAEDTIVACGNQGVDPHERGSGPLIAGETIILDIFPYSKTSGYWGDITRTVIKGKPTPEQHHLYHTVLFAQKQALSRVRPGVTGKEIHQEICDHFVAEGYKSGIIDGVPQGFIHSTGHGVGLEIHEAPSIGPSGGELKAGHVITIEPGLYYPNLGGVRIEDTVVVTESGFSLLARCKKEFDV
jgi:Xaa-Pro aminopeptidase